MIPIIYSIITQYSSYNLSCVHNQYLNEYYENYYSQYIVCYTGKPYFYRELNDTNYFSIKNKHWNHPIASLPKRYIFSCIYNDFHQENE